MLSDDSAAPALPAAPVADLATSPPRPPIPSTAPAKPGRRWLAWGLCVAWTVALLGLLAFSQKRFFRAEAGWADTPKLTMSIMRGRVLWVGMDAVATRFGGGFGATGEQGAVNAVFQRMLPWHGQWTAKVHRSTGDVRAELSLPLLALVPLPWLWLAWRGWRREGRGKCADGVME